MFRPVSLSVTGSSVSGARGSPAPDFLYLLTSHPLIGWSVSVPGDANAPSLTVETEKPLSASEEELTASVLLWFMS